MRNDGIGIVTIPESPYIRLVESTVSVGQSNAHILRANPRDIGSSFRAAVLPCSLVAQE